ncbi:PREDICTED: uncharacterized protein LOC108536709 [Rhinopithecus bieti]|uniref:uncharacterized protein LOC108536709 n=1 Tax=Rhinopithecus bieti TaxID=61621 RepID=UPI00083BE75A|nr:PREDICTED: uncharacterized protein LOC108536709 [Rhinopithecus bieti]
MDTRRSTLEIITESGAGRGTNRGEGTSSASKGGRARPKAWAGGHVLPWPPAALPSRRPGPRRRILTAVQPVSLCARRLQSCFPRPPPGLSPIHFSTCGLEDPTLHPGKPQNLQERGAGSPLHRSQNHNKNLQPARKKTHSSFGLSQR